MSLILGNGPRTALAVLIFFAGATLLFDLTGRRQGAALALEAEEVRSLCQANSYPPDIFWERARAMGIVGAVLRTERLGPYLRSGEVNRFDESEIEKLRATGVAARDAPLAPGALWVKGDALARRLESSARAQGLPLSARVFAQTRVLELPAGTAADAFTIGYPPDLLAALSRAGWKPLFLVDSDADARLIPDGEGGGAVLLPEGLERLHEDSLDILEERLRSARLRLAVHEDRRGGSVGRTLERLLDPRRDPVLRIATFAELPAEARADAVRRKVEGAGTDVVVLRLRPADGIEGNLRELRRLLRSLRPIGYAQAFSLAERPAKTDGPVERLVRLILGLTLACLGPIMGLRQGLETLRWMHRESRLPETAPWREAFAATAATTAVSAAFGLGAYALLSMESWRLGEWRGAATAAAEGAALLAAALALLPSDPRSAKGAAAPARRSLPGLLCALLAAGVLLFPPDWLLRWGPAAWFTELAGLSPGLWWLPLHWKEAVVGYPCLFAGFGLHLGALSQRSVQGRDPRLWLFFGMFAPLGLTELLAATCMPFESVLFHTAASALAGAVLGAAALAVSRVRSAAEI